MVEARVARASTIVDTIATNSNRGGGGVCGGHEGAGSLVNDPTAAPHEARELVHAAASVRRYPNTTRNKQTRAPHSSSRAETASASPVLCFEA
jgi:hypothetical protein